MCRKNAPKWTDLRSSSWFFSSLFSWNGTLTVQLCRFLNLLCTILATLEPKNKSTKTFGHHFGFRLFPQRHNKLPLQVHARAVFQRLGAATDQQPASCLCVFRVHRSSYLFNTCPPGILSWNNLRSSLGARVSLSFSRKTNRHHRQAADTTFLVCWQLSTSAERWRGKEFWGLTAAPQWFPMVNSIVATINTVL